VGRRASRAECRDFACLHPTPAALGAGDRLAPAAARRPSYRRSSSPRRCRTAPAWPPRGGWGPGQDRAWRDV